MVAPASLQALTWGSLLSPRHYLIYYKDMSNCIARLVTIHTSIPSAVLKVHSPYEFTDHCKASCFIFSSERKGHSGKGSVPTTGELMEPAVGPRQHLAWNTQGYRRSFQVLLALGVLSLRAADTGAGMFPVQGCLEHCHFFPSLSCASHHCHPDTDKCPL